MFGPAEGALMVTSYYEQRQKWRETIEFFIMAKCSDKALELAIHENEMETFTDIVGDSITPECAATVAQYYETLQVDILKAGKFYSLCGQVSNVLCWSVRVSSQPHKSCDSIILFTLSVPSSLESLSSVWQRQACSGCCYKCRWKSQK